MRIKRLHEIFSGFEKSIFEKLHDKIDGAAAFALAVAKSFDMEKEFKTMIALNIFKKYLEENEDCFPLLTLDEFFNGNIDEDSIAPNQWEYGRPSLAEIWGVLQRIEGMPNVAWVRVALHNDTEIEKSGEKEILTLAGDSIIICADMESDELEKTVNCEWLCSDGVIELELSQLDIYSRIPSVPHNFNCLEIVWD